MALILALRHAGGQACNRLATSLGERPGAVRECLPDSRREWIKLMRDRIAHAPIVGEERTGFLKASGPIC